LGGQVAAYLVQSELERRIRALDETARLIAGTSADRRDSLVREVRVHMGERFPSAEILVADAREELHPEVSPPPGWSSAKGILVKDRLLYLWSHVSGGSAQVTLMFPLTRGWLSTLAPGLGSISILHFPFAGEARRVMRFHDAADEDPQATEAPAPANRFDLDLLWGNDVPLSVWEVPSKQETAILGVHSRLSALLNFLVPSRADNRVVLILIATVLALVQVASIYAGVTLTRTITSAVHDLYEGTEHVQAGDFAHRIPVRGDDQLAQLGSSFNRMTENVERLLEVSKEKERMEAELQVARRVQAQLFPRETPTLRSLAIEGVCVPARTVSGDYYDYQLLPDGRLLIALGDVAGKGVSASLLMASLQACVRMQVSQCATETVSGMMTRLNQQLHANTTPEKYATFFLGLYDDSTGELVYTNAGHLPPLLVRDGKVQPLDVNGMVVGAFPFAKYGESSVTLQAGDLLFCYSDGVTEAENEFGEMFGDARLAEVLGKPEACCGKAISFVTDAVRQFTGAPEFGDDLTLLMARRL
ncbi:MAG: SpoIIE family protein phosphatase, partial [Bryobacteraceae bacterium]